MTIQAFILLKKLKKAQMKPSECVYIDSGELTASTIHEVGQIYEVVDLKRYRHSLDSTLYYLQGQGYIVYERDIVQVLHSGWHLEETLLSEFFGFLLKSVVVPVVVSLATTLITLWIQGYFAG